MFCFFFLFERKHSFFLSPLITLNLSSMSVPLNFLIFWIWTPFFIYILTITSGGGEQRNIFNFLSLAEEKLKITSSQRKGNFYHTHKYTHIYTSVLFSFFWAVWVAVVKIFLLYFSVWLRWHLFLGLISYFKLKLSQVHVLCWFIIGQCKTKVFFFSLANKLIRELDSWPDRKSLKRAYELFSLF